VLRKYSQEALWVQFKPDFFQKNNCKFAPHFSKKIEMGGLTRKGLNLKIRTVTKQKIRKHLSFQPVIKKVDVEAVKEEWGKKASKKSKTDDKGAPSPKESSEIKAVKETKSVEAKVEEVIGAKVDEVIEEKTEEAVKEDSEKEESPVKKEIKEEGKSKPTIEKKKESSS